MTETFDPHRHARMLLSDVPITSMRLTFNWRCAAFAAFQIGFKAPMIAKAFGISRQTANYIAGCKLHPTGDKRGRYSEVADEFIALGDTEFIKRYYTQEIGDRLERVKHNAMRMSDDRSTKGPDRRADSHCFRKIGTVFQGSEHWRIDWTLGDAYPEGEGGPGWRFTHCAVDGEKPEGYFYQGRELATSNPYGEVPKCAFRTSKLAYKTLTTAFL